MGKLTTHVLDTSAGIPAAGIKIQLHDLSQPHGELLGSQTTGADGRCATPLIDGVRFRRGRYLLTFAVGDYFRGRGVDLPEPAFIDDVIVRVGVSQPEQHYHVPLLISPWSFSVYRGG